MKVGSFTITDSMIDDMQDQCRLLWTRDQLVEMVRLYLEEKKNCKEIAKLYGISYNTCRRMLTILGVELRASGATQRKFTDEDEKFFLTCNRRGLSVTALAAVMRVTVETMNKSLRRARIKDSQCPKCKTCQSA